MSSSRNAYPSTNRRGRKIAAVFAGGLATVGLIGSCDPVVHHESRAVFAAAEANGFSRETIDTTGIPLLDEGVEMRLGQVLGQADTPPQCTMNFGVGNVLRTPVTPGASTLVASLRVGEHAKTDVVNPTPETVVQDFPECLAQDMGKAPSYIKDIASMALGNGFTGFHLVPGEDGTRIIAGTSEDGKCAAFLGRTTEEGTLYTNINSITPEVTLDTIQNPTPEQVEQSLVDHC